MSTNIKTNIISLIITAALFVVSSVVFMMFVSSDDAKNKDIDTSKVEDSDDNSVYYTVSDGEFVEVEEKASGDFGRNFSDIVVEGELSDANGNIEFKMENGVIKASYVNQSVTPNTYGYDALAYETEKFYTVDSDLSDDNVFQGYVYYSSSDGDSEETKELCRYIEASDYFTMVKCEDEDKVYTTINTSFVNKEGNIDGIKNNALYQFNKETKETLKLKDLNFHTEGKFIEGIACNDKYIYMLINDAEEHFVKVYDKDDYTEITEEKVEITEDVDKLAKKLAKDYEDVRKVEDYEIVEEGYSMFACDTGLVIIKQDIVAEIDGDDGKHYGEKGYSTSYEEKGIEPFVREIYTVSSFAVEGESFSLDNRHVCKTPYIYDYVWYKNGLTYILTNIRSTDSDVLEKVKVTSLSNGKIFEEININLNKISNTSGEKQLKYLLVK